MGKQWKKDGKLSTANKKGQLFTKIAREIQVAARSGSDPNYNARLKAALQWARSQSVPAKTIQRALEKKSDKEQLEEVLYEGFGPFGVALMVSCYTDNKVRTVAEVKNIFKKNGGSMEGSVLWMFNQVGRIEAQKEGDIDMTEEALEVGALDVEAQGESLCFYCDTKDTMEMAKQLEQKGWSLLSSQLTYQAKQEQSLTPEQAEALDTLIEALEEQQDCQQVYSNIE